MSTSSVPPPQPASVIAPVTPNTGPQTAQAVKSSGKTEKIRKDKDQKQKQKRHKDEDGEEHKLDIEV